MGPETGLSSSPGGEAVVETVYRLRVRRIASLSPLVLFLLVSVEALPDFTHLPALPESLRSFLGFGPSPAQVGLALLVYSLSATLLSFRRLLGGLAPERGYAALAYLIAFYGFYHFAGGTLENRLAVLVSGVTLLALDCCGAWLWYGRQIDGLVTRDA